MHNVDYYIERIMERKKFAITHHLFQDIYLKNDVNERQQNTINSLITEIYIMTYLEDFGGDIPIPTQIGLRDFTYLSKLFPINNIVIWHELYDKIGCIYFIDHCNESDMLNIFSDNIFIKFIDSVCIYLNNIYNKIIILFQFIPRMPEITKISIDLFLSRIEKVTNLFLQYNYEKDINNGGKYKMKKERTVFVVHGRNKTYRKSIFDFLKSIDLYPLE